MKPGSVKQDVLDNMDIEIHHKSDDKPMVIFAFIKLDKYSLFKEIDSMKNSSYVQDSYLKYSCKYKKKVDTLNLRWKVNYIL